ncbi:ash family protein [Vreelandella stevensii]|uniref:ash family protein n=1 Tax=Vreelandella stevensii TaxID=502821 RepID=UPI00403B3324
MLTPTPTPRYASSAGAKSSVGRRNPNHQRRKSAPLTALFLCPSVMAAMRGQASAWPGSFGAGIPTPRIVATQSRRKDRGDSNTKGVTPMAQLRLSNLITRSLSSRAAAHRAMAKAALFADSSTRTRLKRYNHHIEKAQQLEARALETAKRSVGAVS